SPFLKTSLVNVSRGWSCGSVVMLLSARALIELVDKREMKNRLNKVMVFMSFSLSEKNGESHDTRDHS
ncbi:MAG: hypothetical protein KDD50_08680, partial [Bdellovibrionales bacterium]|nr:hypothetical protein [Bdellovibrionales bacterium]